MRVFKVINNQSGMMAMMGAMIFTIAITTTLSTFYVYTLNQAKYHARIKEAYQLINIMESFATATRKAYDMGMSAAAKSENCPDANGVPNAGLPPQAINGTSPPKFFCAPTNASTCFRREDTNEEYCATIQFNANLQIKRQEMYVENNPNSFLKSWRRGLNDFFISPGIKDRVVDTSTMAYVIQRPMLLDWLVSTAHAVQGQQGEADTGYIPGENREVGKVGDIPALPNPTPGGGGGTIVSHSGYINCETRKICVVSYPSQTPGGTPIPAPASQCPRSMQNEELARFCNNCTDNNQFCPGVGSQPGNEGEGGITVTGSDGRSNPLPARQMFSIVM
jgi:hypothetical protein